MRVLVVASTYFVPDGPRFVHDLVEALRQRVHVEVETPQWPYPGSMLESLREHRTRWLWVPLVLWWWLCNIRNRRFDVLNSHWLVPGGLVGALSRPRAHVVTVHGGDLYFLKRIPLGGAIARYVVASTC